MLEWIIAAAGAVIAALIWGMRLRRRSLKGEKAAAKTKEESSFPEILAQKCRLEQEMAGVVGGKTGMAMLLDMIQGSAPEGGQKDFYRENYRRKQVLLGQYMKEYDELLKRGSALPEKERSRLAPAGECEQYRMLLGRKV